MTWNRLILRKTKQSTNQPTNQPTNGKWVLYYSAWNYLTVRKEMSYGSFESVMYRLCVINKIFNTYTNTHTHTCTHPHWRVLIERNSLSVDDNIYATQWGLSTLVKKFSAAASIMQSSSKELSTLVADRV